MGCEGDVLWRESTEQNGEMPERAMARACVRALCVCFVLVHVRMRARPSPSPPFQFVRHGAARRSPPPAVAEIGEAAGA